MKCLPLDPIQQQQLTSADPVRQACFDKLPLQEADAWLVVSDGVRAYGWLSLWWHGTPDYHHLKSGCIGHYCAYTAEAAALLLKTAQTRLREQGVEQIIAPMNGNSWHAYRLTSESSAHPPFFLDLDTPLEWNAHFRQAEFKPIARYVSTCSNTLDYVDECAQKWLARFETQPAHALRPLRMDDIDRQLQEIYQLSLLGFRRNFLYTDISLAQFEALYRPVLALIDPELVQMAYVDEQLAGFAFAVPDIAQRARGETVDSLILKTFVRHPDPSLKGLGAFLVWNAHRMARQRGYRQLVVAFMHEQNASLQLSLKAGHIIRGYTLYGKAL